MIPYTIKIFLVQMPLFEILVQVIIIVVWCRWCWRCSWWFWRRSRWFRSCCVGILTADIAIVITYQVVMQAAGAGETTTSSVLTFALGRHGD